MSLVEVESIKEHIVMLKLNRPEVYNALNRALLSELNRILDELMTSTRTRVVVLTGKNVFCTGADLKERRTFTEEDVRNFIPLIRDTFTKLEALPQPVVASIAGYAFGGGMELSLCCDLRIAGDNTWFGLLETSLGIIPGAGGTQRLPRLIGEAKAKELIFLAEKISSKQAMELGLIHRLVREEEVLETAIHLAEKISRNAPLAIKQAKKAMHLGRDIPMSEGLEVETHAYDLLIKTEDRLEGLKAFKEKRTPHYLGV